MDPKIEQVECTDCGELIDNQETTVEPLCWRCKWARLEQSGFFELQRQVYDDLQVEHGTTS